MAHLFDQRRRDFTPYGFTCERWTPARMPRPDRHNEIEINLLTGGALTYLVGGRKVRVPAGRLAIFWAAIPHQIIETQGLRPTLQKTALRGLNDEYLVYEIP